MSKRGGSSEVNGFISFNSDDKKTTRRKDESVSKRGSDETVRRKREATKDSTKSTTQSRTRVSEGASTKESSKSREESSRIGVVKEKSATSEKTEIKLGVKKEAQHSLVQKRKPAVEGKPSTSSRNNQKPQIDKTIKSKVSTSSPYMAAASGRPKIMQNISQPQIKKKPSSLQRESPYRSSLAQKPQPRTSTLASGDQRKPSQLAETPAKSKTLKTSKTALTKSSKPVAIEPVKQKKSSSSSSKSKVTVSKRREEKVTSILEEPVLESEQQLKPFGEIHRSNTFTKEGSAPDSLTSDLTASQSQEFGSLSSVDRVDVDDYNYDDDFEASSTH
ncbi:uncharacterized protein LOC124355857 isoform X1 [Homalodisca vitripennis]|uniref:uncharacterized protein LOC124355857 isoform X1 n=1 Tax=Homalodisca vitripennis TaxID=197043 RepID=UPI001EEAA7C5|nr:uncharacterized protein LOC124355857 isoform X1 [Homalodisca vitripennis]